MERLILASLLMLALVSPALADTARCTTRYDEGLQRWLTTCTDGSRAITRWEHGLQRYYTDVITPPKGEKPPRGWSGPGKAPR
jgi:hypothetical protein